LRREPKDLAASVRARLLSMSTPETDEFQDLLGRYARERLLYRLSRSEWREQFVLKGAALFAVWSRTPYRSTRDVDLLGYMPPDPGKLEEVFRALCGQEVEPDGLVFLAESVRTQRIREEDEYQGIRVTLEAALKRTRIPVQVDIGTGDKVVPPPEEIVYPTMLGMAAPKLKAYSRYTVIAEKLAIIAELGIANSRMRDYYDIWALARLFEFEGPVLRAAIEATFGRRKLQVPRTAPIGLSDDFASTPEKQTQWRAFLDRSALSECPVSLSDVVERTRDFIEPVLTGAAKGQAWASPDGWQKN
jgi:predicted nucleotidyltransferase component of viral defense system